MTLIRDFACTIFGFVLACIVAVSVTYGLNLSSGEAFAVGILAGVLLFQGGLLLDTLRG